MNGREVANYFVVRYMYNELGDEAANVGVIVAGRHPKEVTYRFLPELKAKDRVDAQINAAVVDDFRTWLEREVMELPSRGETADWLSKFEARLREKTGNVIRILGPRSVLTSDPSSELLALYEDWVAPHPPVRRLADRARSISARP
jgi:Protein of unknown function (DUF3037)